MQNIVDGFLGEVKHLANLTAEQGSDSGLVMRDMDVIQPALRQIGLRVQGELGDVLRKAKASAALTGVSREHFGEVQKSVNRAFRSLLTRVVESNNPDAWKRAARVFAQGLKPAFEDLEVACEKAHSGGRVQGMPERSRGRSVRRGGRKSTRRVIHGGKRTVRRGGKRSVRRGGSRRHRGGAPPYEACMAFRDHIMGQLA